MTTKGEPMGFPRTGTVGRRVRLRQAFYPGRQTARIEYCLPTLARGAVVLDESLDGLRYWNCDALVYVRERKTAKGSR